MHVRLLATVATAFLVLAVAGCGGDDDGDRAPLSIDELNQQRAEYFTQLDSIYGDFEDRSAAVFDARTAKAGLEAFAAFADDYVSELEDLSPPDEVAGAHDEAVAAGEEARDRILEVAEETADDVPGTDIFEIFFTLDQDPVADRLDAADCALVAIARQAGITLDHVDCSQ